MTWPSADLLITGGRIWSRGALIPGADALAVASGRIVAVGRASELGPLAGPVTRRLDAQGGTVTPGMCDAHIHLIPWARLSSQIALEGAATRAQTLARIARFVSEHPGDAPIVGRGWDEQGFEAPPDRASLDQVTGARPALLHRRDFHALWVNSAALARAGLTRASRDPEGGLIERDAAGEPSGIVRENAVRPFEPLEAEAARAAGADVAQLADAARRLHAFGITQVHDFERGPEAMRTMRAFAHGSGPRVRVVQSFGESDLDRWLAIGLASGLGDDWFRIGALKLFADGTLGSRTAALLAPYEGTDRTGMDVLSRDHLSEIVARALAGGLSVAIHAIGDRAVRNALDAFAASFEACRRLPLPPRIEHAQLVDAADLPRFATLGVAASLQPLHCTSDIARAERDWGSRCDLSYAWRSLLDHGATIAFGSDAPVEPPDVAAALRAAVTRQRADGTPAGSFVPAQRIGLDHALAAYTEGPARLAGAWPRLGTLERGSVADVVVWNADLHAMAADRLSEALPLATVLDGQVVHEAPLRGDLRESGSHRGALVTGADSA